MADKHYLEQELIEQLKMNSTIFEFIQAGALDGIWYWDLDKPENEWMSEKFWLTLGYEPSTMPHRIESWQDIIFPEDLKLATENFQRHCEDPSHPYDQIVRYRHANGSIVWIRCRGLAIRDSNGKPVRMLGAHTDITALKHFQSKWEQTLTHGGWTPWLSSDNSLRILQVVVIEDDEADAALLCHKLMKTEVELDIKILSSVTEVDAFFSTSPCVHIVFVDYNIGAITGVNLIERYRKLYKQLPFVVLTGTTDEQVIFEAMRAGATDFLRKNELTTLDLQRTLNQVHLHWQQQQQLQLQAQLLSRQATILDFTPDFVGVANREHKILYLNDAAKSIIGLDDDSALSTLNIFDVHPNSCHKKLRTEVLPTIAGGNPWRGELTIKKNTSGEIPVSVVAFALWDGDGQLSSIAAIMRDISKEKEIEKSLEYSANYDSLTGLANRKLLLELLTKALAKAKRSKSMLALLYLDLDHFKAINDTLGHKAGDTILQTFSERVLAVVRESEMVGRIGGDEFVVVMQDITAATDALGLANRILNCMKPQIKVKENSIFMTPSIGIATYPESGLSPSELLKNADLAMYHAKKSGRNEVHFFHEGLQNKAIQYEEMRHKLKLALAKNELYMVYQTIVDQDNTIIGWEALSRWQRLDGHTSMPNEFINIAEKSNQIVELGRWVITKVLSEFTSLKGQFKTNDSPFISINISGYQLRDNELLQFLVNECQQNQIKPQQVLLELTESTLLNKRSGHAELLRRLAAKGFAIAVDDFGTGYASYRHLRELPISVLKIDRCFIAGVDHIEESAAFTKSLLTLAKGLSIRVIAEGVETEEEAAFLREHDCSQMQGYLFHRPTRLNGQGT